MLITTIYVGLEVDHKRHFRVLLNDIKDLCWVAQINDRERDRDDYITWN